MLEASNDTQQSGPSVTPDLVTVSREELDSLRKELIELRNRSPTPSAVSFSQLSQQPQDGAGMKVLTAIGKLPLPENQAWCGFQDKRSMRRFMNSVLAICKLAGLDNRGAFHFLTTRCLDAQLAEELLESCPALLQDGFPDYGRACLEAEAYLMERYHLTNRTDKFVEKFNSKVWCSGIDDFDTYIRKFNNMIKEADLLGVGLGEDVRKFYFLCGLPEAFSDRIRDKYDLDLSLSQLIAKIVRWIDSTNENPFADSTVPVVPPIAKRIPVRGVDELQPPRGERHHGKQLRPCYHCQKVGHFIRDCPERLSGVAPMASSRPAQAPVDAHVGNKSPLPWEKVQTVRIASSSVKDDALSKIVLSNTVDGKFGEYDCLLDSGASRCICSRAFANRLLSDGIISSSDALMGNCPDLVFADQSVVSPLGTIRVLIEGNCVEVIVMNSLCSDMIVGFDQITKNEIILHKLIMIAKGCEYESAVQYCAAVCANASRGMLKRVEDCVTVNNEHGESAKVDMPHCEWPPVKLQWKEGAKEALPSNTRQAVAEARQLEARLERKASGLLSSYCEVLADWIGHGWLRPVSAKEVKFCLRHFAVEKDPNGKSAMSRCRVVVDGSSLTPLLDVPPCTHTDLVRNLLLWRLCDSFASVDISQAYMRVEIDNDDSFYLCINWKGRFFRFKSLPMGISPSAQALQAAIDAFISEWESGFLSDELIARICPYMDDLLQLIWHLVSDSGDLEKVEGEVLQSLISFLESKGMKISENKTITSKSSSGTVLGVPFANEHIGVTSKLGRMSVSEVTDLIDGGLTRRKAVSWISSVYDPLGLIAEISVAGRLLASQFSGLAWDKVLPAELATRVGRWVAQVKDALATTEPRWLDRSKVFIFTDASSVGISVVAAARDKAGVWRRLFAKGRLYKKHQKLWVGTSSKIELLGIQLGCQVATYLKKVFAQAPIEISTQFIFGTDSECNVNRMHAGVFEQIKDKWERKVAYEVNNHLANIGSPIYHVPGLANPSDGVSRGIWCRDEAQLVEAVDWFDEERAVRPTKAFPHVVSGVTDPKGDADAPELVIAPVIVQQPSPPSTRMGIAERYALEAGSTKSRAEWMLMYQLEDDAVQRMIAKDKVVFYNGVWVLKTNLPGNGLTAAPVALPALLIENALVMAHDCAGHFGVRKSISRAKESFYWKGMNIDIKRYCLNCLICQRVKGDRHWTSEPGNIFLEGRTWSVIGVDIVKSETHCILTITDWYTRYLFTYAIKHETASLICAKLHELFCLEGAPGIIVSDNALVFNSEEFREFTSNWQVGHKFIPRYSPWYGGFYEVSHKSLIRTLITLMETTKAKWRNVLATATLYHNCRIYEFTNNALSPQEVFRGRKLMSVWTTPPMPVEDPIPRDPVVMDNLPRIIAERDLLASTYESVWQQMRKASMKEIARRNKRKVVFKEGDRVFVWVHRLARRKLESKWRGPFVIDEAITPVLFMVRGRVEHCYNLKKAYDNAGQLVGADAEVDLDDGPELSERVLKVLSGSDKNESPGLPEAAIDLDRHGSHSPVSDGERPEDVAQSDQESCFDEERISIGEKRNRRSPNTRSGLKARLCVVMAGQPKGDMLWI